MVHGELQVRLFGGLSIQWRNDANTTPITRFPTQKIATLLALLALAPGRRYTREVLIDRLWTDAALEDGRRSLRVALSALRRILEPPGTAPGTILIADRETVALRAEAITTDVTEFETAVRQGDVARARVLYEAGTLLPALYDDWVLDARTRLDDTYAHLPKTSRAGIAVAIAEPPPTPPQPIQDRYERLPFYLTRFVGRATEVETLTALWGDDTNRLITITGPGGMGKTRLVTQAAHVALRSRVLRFVSLQERKSREQVREAMVGALGLDPIQASDASIRSALEALGQARLILDNVEQLIPYGIAESIVQWLADCPGLQVVVTSRQRLHVPGERELPLDALMTPTLPATPERLLDFDSVRLFLDRAQLARPDIQITPRNAEMVAALCERLGGLPLALELMASWAGVLTFSQMLARFEAHLLDEAGPPTAARRAARPERHRTLRIALDTSLELLSPMLRTAFTDMAVFQGSFTTDAAHAVLGSDNGAPETVSRLRDRSLLVAETNRVDDTLRFRMLPALYAYARERYEADPVRAATLAESHCDYFLRLAEAPRRSEKALDTDNENLRTALATAEKREDCGTDLRLCIALAPFWERRGHAPYGIGRIERALKRHPDAPREMLAAARYHAGKLAYTHSEFERSRQHHELALEAATAAGDTVHLGRVLQALASLALHADTDIPRAIALADAARTHYQAAGAIAEEAGVLVGRAVIAHTVNDFVGAIGFLQESLALATAAGDVYGQARASHNLGNNLLRVDRLEEAAEHTERALATYRELGSVLEVAYALIDLGNIAYEQGNNDQALRHYQESVTVLRQQGEVWAVSICLSNMGRLASETGAFTHAATLLTESLHLRTRLGAKYGVLQSIDAVINLLVCVAVPDGKPVRRSAAQEAIRLRAADTALRAGLGLPEAIPNEALLARWKALRYFMGNIDCAQLETSGAIMTWNEAITATQAALAQVR